MNYDIGDVVAFTVVAIILSVLILLEIFYLRDSILLKLRGEKVTAVIDDIIIPDKTTEHMIKQRPGLKFRYYNRTTLILSLKYRSDNKTYRIKLKLKPLISNYTDESITDNGRLFMGKHYYEDLYADSDAKFRSELEVGAKIDIIVDKGNRKRVRLDRKQPAAVRRTNVLLVIAYIAVILVLAFVLYVLSYDREESEKKKDNTIGIKKSDHASSKHDDSVSLPDDYKEYIEFWNEWYSQSKENER